jgi:hypothetical protein
MRSAAPGSRLTSKDVKAIVAGVAELPFRTRPTWDQVCRVALDVTRHAYSRQALSAHEPITTAYDSKIAEYRRFRDQGTAPKLVEIDDDPREARIRRLEADKAELEAKVVELDKRVMLHIANAIRLGLSTRDIEQPTDKPWKGATDPKTSRPRAAR